MSKQNERKVSTTALGTCIMRATSIFEEKSHYKSADYVAPKMIPSLMKWMIQYSFLRQLLKKLLFKVPGIYEYVIARTKYIDDLFNHELQQIDQVVILGAGFDSRAIRFKEKLIGKKIFELDAPATQQLKLLKYEENSIQYPSNLKFISIDFNKESLGDRLTEDGFKKGCCLFLLEGLTYYLEPEAIHNTLKFISENCTVGSLLIFDYASAAAVAEEKVKDENHLKKQHELLVKAGEQPGFMLQNNLNDFLEQYGFEVGEKLDSHALAQQYFDRTDFELGAQKFCMVKAIKS